MPAPDATVALVMRTSVPMCTLRTPVLEVARRMRDEGIRTMVVASAGSDLVAGTVGELDLLRAVVEGRTEAMASDVMNEDAPPTVSPGDPLPVAISRLAESRAGVLLVMGGSPPRPVGVLGPAEIAAHIATR